MSISDISPFYSLPRELRDEIYKLSLQHDPSDESTWARLESRDNLSATHSPKILENSAGNDGTQAIEDFVPGTKNEVQRSSSPIFPLSPICLASKTTYHEAIPLFLQLNTIYCSSPSTTHYLFDWLAKFPHPDGYGSIRNLAIQPWMVYTTEYEVFARSRQQDLLGKCTNLRCLTLVFRPPFDNLWAAVGSKSNPLDAYAPLEVSMVKQYQFEEVFAIPMLGKLVLDFSSPSHRIIEKLSDWYVGRWKEEGRTVALEYKFDDGEQTGFMMFD
jgi:hypothetical protein